MVALSFLSKVLSDDSLNPSSIRVAAFWVTIVFTVVWGVISIKTWVIQPVSYEMVGLIASLWGIKAYQKGKEDKVK